MFSVLQEGPNHVYFTHHLLTQHDAYIKQKKSLIKCLQMMGVCDINPQRIFSIKCLGPQPFPALFFTLCLYFQSLSKSCVCELCMLNFIHRFIRISPCYQMVQSFAHHNDSLTSLGPIKASLLTQHVCPFTKDHVCIYLRSISVQFSHKTKQPSGSWVVSLRRATCDSVF